MAKRPTLRERAARLKTDIPALYLALRRKETPLSAKLLAGLTVAYALSPIDLVPDFIPVLGYLDDLLILPALAYLAIRRIPAPVLVDCRREAEGLCQNGKPKKWYYAIPIAVFWLLLLGLAVKLIFF